MDLPTTITYHQVQQALVALVPDLPITRIMSITIHPTEVTIEVTNPTSPYRSTHSYRITHEQGAYTEGGEPTPPPTTWPATEDAR
jgi:hypothetical protein